MGAKSIIVIFILGISLGYFAGRPAGQNPEPPVCGEQECKDKLDALKSKFEKISEEDIAEYIQLKEMKAKYEKADEIFGKILTIFLLDLGMRVSGKQMDDLKSAPSAMPPPPSVNQAEVKKQTYPIPTVPPVGPPKRVSRVNTNNVNSDEEVKKLLDDHVLEDPIAAWGSAKAPTRMDFNHIRGKYSGQITFFDKERNPLDVEMELTRAQYENGTITGEFLLKTSDPRNPKYRDTTTADAGSTIRNFKSTEDGAILVEAMGGDGVFQLYFFRQYRSLQGSVYEKRGLEAFKRTGTIVLNRR